MAIGANKVWVAVIAILVLGAGWGLVSSISAKNAEARAAAEKARVTAEAEQRQAALARQAARDALMARLSSGSVPQWKKRAGELRYLAFKGAENVGWSSETEFCPDYWKLRRLDSPKDEFERRDRELKEQELRESCMREVRDLVAQDRGPFVARCALKEPTYDFGSQAFKMQMVRCRLFDGTTWYIRGEDVFSEFVLEGGASTGTVDEVTVRVPVEESKARDFKTRLVAEPTLEIALESGEYGPTSLSRPPSGAFEIGRQAVQAMKGRALAFRIVASGRPIIDWTPYGKDSEGKEVIPRVLVDAPTSNSKAQQLRDRMPANERETLKVELAKMRSPNRWPQAQQDRYVKVCMKAKKDEPSINRRVCECYLEVMMERYATMGDFSKNLVNNGVQNDEEVAGLTGMCVAAFGD
jgi:hypothetical protein